MAVTATMALAAAAVTPAQHDAERSAPDQRPVVVNPTSQVLRDIRVGTCTLTAARGDMTVPAGGSSGVAVFTSVDLVAGQPVAIGAVVAEVSGRPLIALDLPFPLYRDVTPGLSGPDVAAIQESLARLGRLDGPATGTFDRPTQRAVERLYADLRVVPARTGADLDDAARQAEVAEMDLRSRAGIDPTVTADSIRVAAEARRVALSRVGTLLPANEVVVPPPGMTVTRVAAEVGGAASADTIVAEFSGPTATADCAFSVASGQGLSGGVPATLRTSRGVVAGTIDEPRPAEDGTLTVRFAPTSGALGADLGGQTSSLEVTAAATSGEVLAVPVGTLREAPGGGTAVAVRVDGKTRTVPVEVGLVADGYAEVTGALDLSDDLLVTLEPAP